MVLMFHAIVPRKKCNWEVVYGRTKYGYTSVHTFLITIRQAKTPYITDVWYMQCICNNLMITAKVNIDMYIKDNKTHKLSVAYAHF